MAESKQSNLLTVIVLGIAACVLSMLAVAPQAFALAGVGANANADADAATDERPAVLAPARLALFNSLDAEVVKSARWSGSVRRMDHDDNEYDELDLSTCMGETALADEWARGDWTCKKVSGSEFLSIVGDYSVSLSGDAPIGRTYTAVFVAKRSSFFRDKRLPGDADVINLTLSVTAVPGQTVLASVSAGWEDVTASWFNVDEESCDGYELQISRHKDFSKAKTVKVKRGERTQKTVKHLKPRKRYYVRVRAYAKGDGIHYGGWSEVERSDKTLKLTAKVRQRYKLVKPLYAKMRKRAIAYGWQVSDLHRSTMWGSGRFISAATPDKYAWETEFRNGSYTFEVRRINVRDDGTFYFYYEIHDNSNGKLVRVIGDEDHDLGPFYPDPHATGVLKHDLQYSYKKSIANDLKRYSDRYEKPRLNIETVVLRKGESVDLKVLNTDKPVKWYFAVHDKKIKKECKRIYKLTGKTKTGITLQKNGKKPKYTLNQLKAKVGGKVYVVEILNPVSRWGDMWLV